MMGVDMSRLFAIKCLLCKYPFKVLSIMIFITVLILAHLIMIIEGALKLMEKEKISDYSNFENCVWTVLVTMSTVGYGDFSPNTNYGRLILIFASFAGSIQVSLFVITIQNQMSMNPFEASAYEFFDRIVDKKEVEKKGAVCFKSNFLFLKRKNDFMHFLGSGKKDPEEYQN
jgi:hypothetical protein